MDNYDHLIRFCADTKRLEIYRKFGDGREVLYTSLDLTPYVKNIQSSFGRLAKQLGENILLDSAVARELLKS